MKKNYPYKSIVFVLLLLVMQNSNAQLPVLPDIPYNYANPILPPYFTEPLLLLTDNTPPTNPVTDAGATLGRVLFYDKLLSANNTTACASCHLQEHSFSDTTEFSVGFNGGLTTRNSMFLVNNRYYFNRHFFWDERAPTLEEQVLMPIQDPIEMGLTLPVLETKLQATTYYPDLFNDAFGSPTVTSENIAKALAQFIRSILSSNSKYDKSVEKFAPDEGTQIDLPNFTAEENLGRRIFFDKGVCNICHAFDIFTGIGHKNNGLDMNYADNGIGDVLDDPAMNGFFKTPSLRNIALTAPYMHDGRFNTLMEVVEHYDSGVQAHPNLSFELKDSEGTPFVLNLSMEEKEALVAFLETLTDYEFIKAAKYSDPFAAKIIEVKLKMYLEGAYDESSSLMKIDLLMSNLLPLEQPFGRKPWNYEGTERVASINDFPVNVVDWVLVEARDKTNNSLVLERKAALLLSNGDVVEFDGTSSGVKFYNLTLNESYYLSVRHRNHLAIMSANEVEVPNTVPYDFTQPTQVLGGKAQVTFLGNNTIYGLHSGDANADGVITVNDFNFFADENAQTGTYLDGDFSLDGTISTSDFNKFQPNASKLAVYQLRL